MIRYELFDLDPYFLVGLCDAGIVQVSCQRTHHEFIEVVDEAGVRVVHSVGRKFVVPNREGLRRQRCEFRKGIVAPKELMLKSFAVLFVCLVPVFELHR